MSLYWHREDQMDTSEITVAQQTDQDEGAIKTLLGCRILWDAVTWSTTRVTNLFSADRFYSSDTKGDSSFESYKQNEQILNISF